MNRTKILIALICLLIPGLITSVWFYSGFPQTKSSAIPDYPTIDLQVAPISTVIPLPQPPSQPKTSVLFDMSHNNMISLTEIDPLIRSIESDGGTIQITGEEIELAESLKSVNAFICAAPIQAFSTIEKSALVAFTKRGGKLVVIADPTRNTMVTEGMPTGLSMSSVDAANLILEPYDISFSDDYLYDMVNNEGNFRNILISEFANHELTEGIGRLVIYGGHSVHSSGKSLASTSENTYSSANDHPGKFSPVDIINSGQGSVLAIGDINLLTSQYVQSADNQIFVQNLAAFLTESARKKTLVDFPHLFDGAVIVQPSGKLKVTGELLSKLAELEKLLGNKPGELTVSKEDKKTTDRILLTTFVSNDDTKEILDALKINLSPEPTEEPTIDKTPEPTMEITPTAVSTLPEPDMDFPMEEKTEIGPAEIEVAGLSVTATKDLGIVGLVHDGKRSTLIIMAESPEKIQGLIEELSTNKLSGCLLQENLAACKIFGNIMEPKG